MLARLRDSTNRLPVAGVFPRLDDGSAVSTVSCIIIPRQNRRGHEHLEGLDGKAKAERAARNSDKEQEAGQGCPA